MDNKTKILCITTKISTLIGLLMSIALTPFHIYLYDIGYDVINYSTLQTISVIALILWSLLVFFLMYRGIIDTNDPKTRYNILTFNPNWTNKIR